MRILIDKASVSKFLSVSAFRKVEDFERYARESQVFDLKPLVCEDFYQDLVSETPQRDYALLLDGGSYTYEGRKYEFAGLKAVLAYFAYARYIFTGHQIDTPYGVRGKVYQDGEGVSQSERRDLRGLYVQNANELWEDCKRYIERHKQQFPEWGRCQEGRCGEQDHRGRVRITLI
ncbi:DUF6712 family protein [Capnocytophaga granulosa]|jgi:hypothetical protein|nr:MAG TPA: hypothetical protein [Caudoviricetes sp.]